MYIRSWSEKLSIEKQFNFLGIPPNLGVDPPSPLVVGFLSPSHSFVSAHTWTHFPPGHPVASQGWDTGRWLSLFFLSSAMTSHFYPQSCDNLLTGASPNPQRQSQET